MFSEELRKQARGAKSVQELRTMANERGIEMSAASAEKYYAALHPHGGVVADDELANVTGGGCGDDGGSGGVGYYFEPPKLYAIGDSLYINKKNGTQEGPYKVLDIIRCQEGTWKYQLKACQTGWYDEIYLTKAPFSP